MSGDYIPKTLAAVVELTLQNKNLQAVTTTLQEFSFVFSDLGAFNEFQSSFRKAGGEVMGSSTRGTNYIIQVKPTSEITNAVKDHPKTKVRESIVGERKPLTTTLKTWWEDGELIHEKVENKVPTADKSDNKWQDALNAKGEKVFQHPTTDLERTRELGEMLDERKIDYQFIQQYGTHGPLVMQIEPASVPNFIAWQERIAEREKIAGQRQEQRTLLEKLELQKLQRNRDTQAERVRGK